MAKKDRPMNVNQYASRDEEIRKAKGNPNKNIHAKKKNSNYGGYAAGHRPADKTGEGARQQERVKLPTWMNVTLIIDLVVILALLLLRMTALKDSDLLTYCTTLLLGLTCAFLFYVRRFKHKVKTTMYKVIQVVLGLVAVVYVYMGIVGILAMFGVL